MKNATLPLKKYKNLLFYGDFNCSTGFGNVSKELIDNWSKDKDLLITVFAINDFTERPYKYKDNVTVIPALPTSEIKDDVYARVKFLEVLNSSPFDVLFCLNDVEIFNEMFEHLNNVKKEKKKTNRPNFKSILYFPIDSEPRMVDLKVLDFFDEIITYTQYAKNALKPLMPEAKHKKLKVIGHGCNTKDFYPLSEQEKNLAKIKLIGEEYKDCYLFGSVNRNSSRKDFGALIMGFAMFKHTNENVNAKLYLHCNPLDPSGINFYRICDRVGLRIGEDIILPKNFSENKGFSNNDLNDIYNAFDCFITTTTAEGWGLTITEAMATKTLVICPLHTSITEISDNGKNVISFMYSQRNVFCNDGEKIRFTTNPVEVKKLCEIAYNIINEADDLKETVRQKIENAHEFVKSMRWDLIAKEFKVIIDRLAK